MPHQHFRFRSSIVLCAFLLCTAPLTHAQQPLLGFTLGPELLVGVAAPETSPSQQPITAYQAGLRGYVSLDSSFVVRLDVTYRHLDIRGSSTYYSYDFAGDYLFVGPALRYKWFELGVDLGTPLNGNFFTFGGSLADTSSSLGSSEMTPLAMATAAAFVPIATTDGSQLSLVVSASYELSSSAITKQFILHDPSSHAPVVTTGGQLGPIGSVQVGLTWQFSVIGKEKEEWY